MSTAERDKAVKAAVMRLLAVDIPAVVLICLGMFFWGRHRLATHDMAMAPWEIGFVLIGFAMMGFALWQFATTMKALGVKPGRRV